MSSEIRDLFDAATTSPDAPAYGLRAPGYHLPDATRIGRVRLKVSDLARSLRWYEGVLGLRALERTTDRALLATHGDDAPLVELEAGATDASSRPPRLGLYHVAILLPDRESLGRFASHVAATGARIGAGDHFVSEALYLQDPDGLGIEVYADRPRSQWRVRDRELDIGTVALDLGSLARAAGGTTWTGMPAGTTIGHVHLSVGDLGVAARFYHTALGFDVMTWSYPGALFVSAGGYHHHLGMNTWAGPHAQAAGANEPRLIEWELLVPTPSDAEAAARSLENVGYPVTRVSGGWTARDPWGTPLRVIAEPSAARP